MFIQPVLGFSTTVWFFILCTSPPPCLGLLKRSEGLINEVNFSERTDQCVFVRFFFGGNASSQKSWGVPRFSRGIGRFGFKGFFQVFFFPSPPEKKPPPHVVFNIVYHEKKGNIFSCLISFVLGGSLHTFVFFPSPPEKNTPPRCFQHCLP